MKSYEKAYRARLRELSDRIVQAQTSIRILDSIKWGPEIQADFFFLNANNYLRSIPSIIEKIS